jgi:predicted nucleic acid-binding protein
MTGHWVLNASPIICLAKSGYYQLLKQLPDEVVIPEAVQTEINAGPSNDPAREILAKGNFKIMESLIVPSVAAWDLGLGETAVLSYALSNAGWQAVIDDRAARKCARALEISVRGTLSIVLLAKKRGLIDSAAEVIRALQASGLWVDEPFIRRLLKEAVGEKW